MNVIKNIIAVMFGIPVYMVADKLKERQQVKPKVKTGCAEMSDTEILDWLNEYADEVTQKRSKTNGFVYYTVYCDYIEPARELSLRDAVMVANERLNNAA